MTIQNIPPHEDSLQVMIMCRGTFDYSVVLPSTRSSSLCMGLVRLDFDVGTWSCTLRTRPSLLSGEIFMTLARGHWLRGRSSSFTRTMSLTWKLGSLLIHFCRVCRLDRYSFLHLVQNSLARCWTWRHLLLQYRSFFWKTPGGGRITVVFRVRRLIGHNGRLSGSLSDSTVSGTEFTMHSASVRRVRNDSSLRLFECSIKSADSTLRTDRIWRSQTPPIWLADGGFLFQFIQSQECERRKSPILDWSISLNAFFHSFAVPMKFLPLSDNISLTLPLLAMKRRNAWINESVSIRGELRVMISKWIGLRTSCFLFVHP